MNRKTYLNCVEVDWAVFIDGDDKKNVENCYGARKSRMNKN